jgi:hypothetical protein
MGTLDGLEVVDDVTGVVDPICLGLAVLDRPILPHVDSPRYPETQDCDRVSAEFTRTGLKHWALRDGEVLLIRDEPPNCSAGYKRPVDSQPGVTKAQASIDERRTTTTRLGRCVACERPRCCPVRPGR